ncbi:MAG: hypothetical protein M1831_006585 [Alyxoria varia]|nr:MAG: hypothetical protein M1831_006585 [Alyxoria varia]
MPRPIRIAVEGCGHGTLDAIYDAVTRSCQARNWESGVDLLIIGGDFQAVRNSLDLNCMSVPPKYRQLGDFYEYYSGKKRAPYLTLFVGGNHEASNHLAELYHGGWVAPRIYYAGAANVVSLGGLRIAGLSGIWKGFDFRKPHYERLPYTQAEVRSAYHVREMDVRKLLQLRSQVDVGISHDWPNGMEWKGDWRWLFKKKDLFEGDAVSGRLGSVAAKQVLDRLRPPRWFSAHLHIRYEATLDHAKDESAQTNGEGSSKDPPAKDSKLAAVHNDEEINLSLEDADETPGKSEPAKTVSNTDEIDLDHDDESIDKQTPSNQDATASVVPTRDGSATSAVPDYIRAQLPASFSKAQPPAAEPMLPEPSSFIPNTTTQFLALDKCLPNRRYLELLELPPRDSNDNDKQDQDRGTSDENNLGPLRLHYDPEWLSIVRAFAMDVIPDHTFNNDASARVPQDKGRGFYTPLIEESRKWIEENIVKSDESNLAIPENFELTAETEDNLNADIGAAEAAREGEGATDEGKSDIGTTKKSEMPLEYHNPQTAQFCTLLGIPDVFGQSTNEGEDEKEERISKKRKTVEEEDERERAASRGRGRGRGGGFRGGFRGGRGSRGRGGYRGGSRGSGIRGGVPRG